MEKVYTDGACKGNPGTGGWAWVWYPDDSFGHIYNCGAEKSTTNNRMELKAVIEALSEILTSSELHLYTDSTYVLKGMVASSGDVVNPKNYTGWLKGWISKDYYGVKNSDLWKSLHALLLKKTGYTLRIFYVRGHSGNVGNTLADNYASTAALKLLGVKNIVSKQR